ncbi:Reverse transcriptase ribonuclease h [Mycena venus]|uniref:Reverse transcriptase ribonuclease h n=1 Tax=Mycena venus TaxID=2733690 RepID=A0A8H6XPU7_9AGAR|nr:Reverse transcriptase ribonuclease h [Mycena venus]
MTSYTHPYTRVPFLHTYSIDPASGTISYTYPYDRLDALRRINPTNTPWHPTKGQDFGYTFTYIGFFWDIAARCVSLSENKRLKFLGHVRAFVTDFGANRCKATHVMKLHGSLCHITFVHRLGRSYLTALSSFVASFEGNNHVARYPPPSVFTVLKWWDATLSVPNTSRAIIPRGPLIDRHLFVDASTDWGIGILLEGHWDAWRGKGGWKSASRHIGWLECVTVELLIYAIEERGWHDCYLLVHSDNQGVIGAFDKGRSRNHEMNLSIRRSHYVPAARNITLELLYIPSAENPADPISRGDVGAVVSRLPPNNSFPDDLLPYFEHV